MIKEMGIIMKKNLVVFGLIGVLLLTISTDSLAMSNKRVSKFMTKYLEACKKGNYIRAKQYSKRIPKNAKNEKCVKKMPKRIKKAYSKLFDKKMYPGSPLFTDIDKNGVAEMVVTALGGGADIYTYRKGRVKSCGSVEIGYNWPSVSYYPRHNGLIFNWYHESFATASLSIVSIINGKVKLKTIATNNKPVIPDARYYLNR